MCRGRALADGSVVRRVQVTALLTLALLGVAGTSTMLAGRVENDLDAALSLAVIPALDANSRALVAMTALDKEWEYGQTELVPGRIVAATGRATVRKELTRLQELLRSPTVAASDHAVLDPIASSGRAAAARWFTAIDVADATPSDTAAGQKAATAARRAFADFVEANGWLQTDLRAVRDRLAGQATRTERRREAIAVWVMLISGLVVGGGALSVSRSLGGPLDRLRAVVRRQREGDVTAMADANRGPLELRELARDVNDLTRANSRLHDEQSEVLRLHQLVLEVAADLGRCTDVTSALELVCTRLGTGLGADRVLYYSVANASSGVQDRADWQREPLPPLPPLPRSVTRRIRPLNRALRSGGGYLAVEDLLAEPAASDPRAVALHRATAGWSVLLLPVGSGARALGVLAAIMVDRPRTWRQAEVQAAQQFANIAAETVAQMRLAELQEEQVRRLTELDRHKTDFIGTVSHELRTPLTSIKGYVELLQDGDFGELDPAQRSALGVVGRNAVRLAGLIEDLLVLNKIESSGLSLARHDVAVTDLVGAVVDTIRPMAAAGDVVVRCEEIAEDLSVNVDRGQLERVLINLGSNAVKFTPPGGSATFAATRVDGHVEISVADTGIGIPAADLSRLSERFFRAGNAQSAAIPGTGLGLTIVRTVVEGHGGTLSVSSVEGEGTTMRVLLPRTGAQGGTRPAEEITAGSTVTAPERRRRREAGV